MHNNLDQQMGALERANTVRLARSYIKNDIKTGVQSIGDVIRECPSCMITISLYDLLQCQPQYGRKRVLTLLSRMNLSELKQLGTLTDRQKNLLIHAVAH